MTKNITVPAALANSDELERLQLDLMQVQPQRLEQFAWLIDNAGDDRSGIRLFVLWMWSYEVVRFQEHADRTGEPIDYFQRGEVLRTFYPQTDREAA